MIRRPPRSTRTDTLVPYTTLFRSMVKAAKGNRLKGILAVSDEPLVSSDFNHSPASSTFDLTQTQVLDDTFVRILTWYDNEWGFSNRMSDTRSEERRVGKECVSTCRSRWSPYH